MGGFIVSLVLGIVSIYMLMINHFSKKAIKELKNSIQIQKKLNETAISKLNEKMKDGFDIKSKALAESEELRLKVISELETKQFHFERLERDLDTSHKLAAIQSKEKQAMEVKFVQLRQHYDAIVSAVKLPREFISKISNLEKRLKNAG